MTTQEQRPTGPRRTGRPHLHLGEQGHPWTTKEDSGGYTAGVWVRRRDGKTRQVTASGTSKSAALRNLQRRLNKALEVPADGVQPAWTVADLASYWEDRKARDGHGRRQAPLRDQTRWNHDDYIERVIVPAMGGLRVHELSVPVPGAPAEQRWRK